MESVAFVRSTDKNLFPEDSHPEKVEDATSGGEAPDLELFSSPCAWYEHNPLHKRLPMVDIGTVAAVLLR